MMLKTTNGFLDFDGEVEMERQVKLLEDIKETWGDFSYTFELAMTQNNLSLLGLPYPDNVSKIVYNQVTADLLSDSGEILYKGYLRVERINKVIETSFFSGNNNWLGLLTGNMTDLRLDQYDQPITEENIIARQGATSGITFPIIDTGTLVFRSFKDLKAEDFVGCFYLNTLFREVFSQSGLKIEGELLSDPIFNKAVVATNTRSKTSIDERTIYVGKNTSQVISAGPSGEYVTDFNLTNVDPYFLGEHTAFVGNTFQAMEPMLVNINASIGVSGGDQIFASIHVNGVRRGDVGEGSASVKNVKLQVGDEVKVRAISILGSATIISATFEIRPIFVYTAYGTASVPLWTKEQFVVNVISLFNVITDYDPYTKTVTLNLFNKIKSKTPTDISDYIEVQETDYVEFISNYGKKSTLSYKESDDENLREYNISTFYKYGQGFIEVNNDFISETEEIVDSDFTSPISYLNPKFDASLEKIDFVELEEDDDHEITSVSDAAGTARFNIADAADYFAINDLVRLETDNILYNGDWVVDQVTSSYIVVRGPAYDTSATGTAIRLFHKFTSDDNVYLFINSGERLVSDFSRTQSQFYLEGTVYSEFTLAFFNLINNGTQFNRDFKQSLSFGEISDPLFYQRTLIDTYWGVVSNILNDPAKLKCIAHIPEYIFKRLSPLNPVSVKTMESVNLYYLQKISGYKGSHRPSDVELIKLP